MTQKKDAPILALGEAVRTLRMDARISQEALGFKAGIHPTWISQIENGRVNPTVENLFLLAEGLGVRLSELILLTEEIERRWRSEASAEE